MNELEDSNIQGFERPERSKTHVLIVEDSQDMQVFINNIIKSLRPNMEIDFVSDGLSAVDYLTIRVPDLVITDMLMPGLNGLELMGRVQETYGMNHVRFLLVTGGLSITSTDGITEAEVYSKFCCRIIRKPFRSSILRAEVDKLLREVEDARNTLLGH